jgi:hypothetical protein
MLKSIFLLLAFFACLLIYSQPTDTLPSPTFSKEELIRKSKTKKVIGWMMVATGAPVGIACMYFLTFPDDVIEKEKVVLALVGSAVYTLIGVNLIKSGNRDKNRALSLGFCEQKAPLPSFTRMTYRIQPAVSLRLHF